MKRVYDETKHGYLVKAREEFMLKEWADLKPKRLARNTAWYYKDSSGWIWLKVTEQL